MTERDVIKAVESRSVHVVGAADGDILGIGALCAGDKLVGDDNVAVVFINLHLTHSDLDRVGVGFDFVIGIKAPDVRRLDEGQHVDRRCSVFVRQLKALGSAVVNR